MSGKSIGVYWKTNTLQIIKRTKEPTETFGECVNRLIQESMNKNDKEIIIKFMQFWKTIRLTKSELERFQMMFSMEEVGRIDEINKEMI